MADLKRFLLSIEQLLVLLIGVAVVFFALLNTQSTTVDLFFTEIDAAVSLLILVPLLGGLLLGWIGGGLAARRRGQKRAGREAGKPDFETPLDEEAEDELEGWSEDLGV
jgi:uncharacterized integral membrane protein